MVQITLRLCLTGLATFSRSLDRLKTFSRCYSKQFLSCVSFRDGWRVHAVDKGTEAENNSEEASNVREKVKAVVCLPHGVLYSAVQTNIECSVDRQLFLLR